MNRTKLFIWITFSLLAIAALLLIHQSKSSFEEELKNFAVNDTSSVTKIFMADKAGHQVILSKNYSSLWTVNNKYKANPANIIILLTTMMHLDVNAPVSSAMHNNVLTRMAAIGIKIEIYQEVYRINLFNKIKLFKHEKLTKTYYVGDNTQDMLGTYMLMENAETPFIIQIPGFNGYLTTRYSPKENDWRDHTLIDYSFNQIKSVEIKYFEQPEKSFKITKESKNNFILASLSDNQIINNPDTLKIWEYLTSFNHLMFESFLNDFKGKYSALKTQPFHHIVITDIQGKKTDITTFHKKAMPGETDFDGKPIIFDRDRLFALDNNSKEFVLIQFFVFDRIFRQADYFKRSAKL